MKVLIISHNPITTYQNMGKTMISLFSSFKKAELCQLYIYPTIPDIDFCKSYFRVTDKDVLKSYFRFKVCSGEIDKKTIDTEQHEMFQRKKDQSFYHNQKNKTSHRMLMRDIMWKCVHWYNDSLKQWLKKELPTCIFVAPGSAEFLYDIALKISKKLNIPIVSYICDDYYFVKLSNNLLNRLRVIKLRRKIAKLMKHTSHIVSICDDMSRLYSKEFSVPATTIMTGTNYTIAEKVSIKEDTQAITYMGNIRCNRFSSLAEIGAVLDEINKEQNKEFTLNIYTAEQNSDILSTFDGINSVKLCGYVSGEEFDKVFHSAEILLHTEAFDQASIDMVKHSVSTKIADSLASGIPLFAYGPQQVASMKHLIDNDCAVIATSKDELKAALIKAFYDFDCRKTVAEKSLITAQKYHCSPKNSSNLYEIMESLNEGITG